MITPQMLILHLNITLTKKIQCKMDFYYLSDSLYIVINNEHILYYNGRDDS